MEKPIYKLSDQLKTVMTMSSSGCLPGYPGPLQLYSSILVLVHYGPVAQSASLPH